MKRVTALILSTKKAYLQNLHFRRDKKWEHFYPKFASYNLISQQKKSTISDRDLNQVKVRDRALPT